MRTGTSSPPRQRLSLGSGEGCRSPGSEILPQPRSKAATRRGPGPATLLRALCPLSPLPAATRHVACGGPCSAFSEEPEDLAEESELRCCPGEPGSRGEAERVSPVTNVSTGAQTTLPRRPATSPGSPAPGTSPPGHPPIRAALQLRGAPALSTTCPPAPAHASATRSEFRARDTGQHASGSVLVLFAQQDLHTPETGAVPSVQGGPVLRQMLGSGGGFTCIPSALRAKVNRY